MNVHAPLAPLPFIDLAAQRRRLGERVDRAILKVVNHGQYIMGPEVAALEAALGEFCGAKHVVSCGNGTDALALVLMAKGVRPGQAILCPSFTFAATAEVVAWLGGTPVFVDVDAVTFNITPAALEQGIAAARRLGLEPVGVIPVDLFGQPADYDALLPLCAAEGLFVLSDAAQSFGATYKGTPVGTFGLATTTSFFPAKPLGCYGDGGAIFTDDDALAEELRCLRIHGQNVDDKYDNIRIGMNGRMDTIQAAVLLEKLAIFPEEIALRNAVAARYEEALEGLVVTPKVGDGSVSVWAQYTIRLEAGAREAFAAALKSRGVPTAIYYPKPLHRQTAYARYPVAGNGLPVSDALSAEVISLPMHPYLDEATQDRIVHAVQDALG
jgi:dTDP-4-amino-4,6-dideoxygalactose transaminase